MKMPRLVVGWKSVAGLYTGIPYRVYIHVDIGHEQPRALTVGGNEEEARAGRHQLPFPFP